MATYIPPEYQQQLQQLQRRQQIAQGLMGQALQPQGDTIVPGGVVVRNSPINNIIKLLTANKTQQTLDQGDQQFGQIQGEIAQQRAQQMAEILARGRSNPLGVGDEAMTNPDPQIQAIGKTIAEREQSRRKEIGGYQSTNGDVAGAIATQLQGAPENYSLPALPGPIYSTSPSGAPVAITRNRRGEPTLQYEPKPMNVTNTTNLPGKEAEFALGQLTEEKKTRQKNADIAKDVMQSNFRAIDALEEGAKAGGGQDIKQMFRKGLQAFGTELPDTASIEQLQQAFGDKLLAEVRKVAPVTQNDISTVTKIVGSASTDPLALVKAIAYTQAKAQKALGEYTDYVAYQKQNLSTPYGKDIFSGAEIGYEPPTQLQGPLPFQLEVVRNLKGIGYDISKLKDPSGQPFNLDAAIKVDPREGFPGVQVPPPIPSSLPALPPGVKWVK